MVETLRSVPVESMRRHSANVVSRLQNSIIIDLEYLIYCDDYLNSSRFYFVLYEVTSPLRLRYERFVEKYKMKKNSSMDDFIDLDDKIMFNTEEYSLH